MPARRATAAAREHTDRVLRAFFDLARTFIGAPSHRIGDDRVGRIHAQLPPPAHSFATRRLP